MRDKVVQREPSFVSPADDGSRRVWGQYDPAMLRFDTDPAVDQTVKVILENSSTSGFWDAWGPSIVTGGVSLMVALVALVGVLLGARANRKAQLAAEAERHKNALRLQVSERVAERMSELYVEIESTRNAATHFSIEAVIVLRSRTLDKLELRKLGEQGKSLFADSDSIRDKAALMASAPVAAKVEEMNRFVQVGVLNLLILDREGDYDSNEIRDELETLRSLQRSSKELLALMRSELHVSVPDDPVDLSSTEAVSPVKG